MHLILTMGCQEMVTIDDHETRKYRHYGINCDWWLFSELDYCMVVSVVLVSIGSNYSLFDISISLTNDRTHKNHCLALAVWLILVHIFYLLFYWLQINIPRYSCNTFNSYHVHLLYQGWIFMVWAQPTRIDPKTKFPLISCQQKQVRKIS